MIYTIEDLFEDLEKMAFCDSSPFNGRVGRVIASPADRKFIADLCCRTKTGGRFSTKQAEIARKIISKHAKLFSNNILANKRTINLHEEAVLELCKNPIYRSTPYESIDRPRLVRFLGDRKLGFSFKFSPQIIEKIKNLSDTITPSKASGFPYFNKTHRIWVVDVTENNLDKVMNLIKKFSFTFDEDVVQFLTFCSNSVEETSAASIDDNNIYVTVQNNDLLHRWLVEIVLTEETLNV